MKVTTYSYKELGIEPPTDEEFARWCQCESVTPKAYADDSKCACGIDKHHYHCINCGKVSQIG